MDEIAVLGMLEAEQRPVRGERTPQEPTFVDAAQADRLRGAVDLARRGAFDGHVDGESVAVAQAGRDDARRLRQTFAPAVRNAIEKHARVAPAEGLHEPAPGLVAALVLEPDHALPVERGCAVHDTHRVIGDCAAARRCPHSTRAPARHRTGSTRRRLDREPAAPTPGRTRRARESAAPRVRRSLGRG